MKKVFLTAGLIAALALAVFATVKPANFAGTWVLDKAKSQGLSQRLQGADSVTWTITQDDKTISIDSKVTGGQPPAGAGGGAGSGSSTGSGGGQGRGMGGGMGGPQSYNLDGKEVTTQGQNGSTSTMKATWSGDGSTLELLSIRAGNFNGNEFKSTSTDKLSLSGDGKTLTVNRHSESPRGTTDSTLVFNKQ